MIIVPPHIIHIDRVQETVFTGNQISLIQSRLPYLQFILEIGCGLFEPAATMAATIEAVAPIKATSPSVIFSP